ncbi:HAD-like domain-containing protein [Trichoderma camerunense]
MYKAVYRKNRRATPGSIEALARLREYGYRIAIITNGQIEGQTAKVKAIGMQHLIDRIITSEEARYRKPDRRIFQYAIEKLDASLDTACMIGDSVDSDIKGANHTTHGSTPRLFEHRRPLSSAAFCLHSGPADDGEY